MESSLTLCFNNFNDLTEVIRIDYADKKSRLLFVKGEVCFHDHKRINVQPMLALQSMKCSVHPD